ncbi:exodeoxyribonuclease III [Sinimarinibacterium sp. NLF-5-8]|uniref:exodeoxyribonuclease III n=1 Tax=Sinimarinibacterium sp. NLF-5-8 TaxID=2698684 RepID=UPI00137BA545|nr:exodeoxyribonuclease III [Sinimarinibacterium sp. NLF-5-8]QHS09300.1 exodeoxyribonuclease III [Sinimarinibacterium sp. NLF-5-8]
MKIATWNVNSLRVRLPHLLDWLASAKPDVVGLQETKCTDDQFPFDALADAGYHVIHNGQKTYNGVALLSREPLQDEARDLPGFEDEQKRIITATVGGVRIINAYVVNGQALGSDKYAYKLRFLEALHQYAQAELARHEQLLIMGDFNIAPAPEDTHDPDKWEGDILCSEPERAGLRALLDLGLKDTFRLFDQEPDSFTWWDYRQAGFRRNLGLRIDHILASTALAQQCTACSVDKNPRKLERPSDHAPLIATFNL